MFLVSFGPHSIIYEKIVWAETIPLNFGGLHFVFNSQQRAKSTFCVSRISLTDAFLLFIDLQLSATSFSFNNLSPFGFVYVPFM